MFPLSFLHPDRLCSIATLCKLRTAPVDQARMFGQGEAFFSVLFELAARLPNACFYYPSTVNVKTDYPNNVLPWDTAKPGRFDYLFLTETSRGVESDLDFIRVHLAEYGVAMLQHGSLPGAYMGKLLAAFDEGGLALAQQATAEGNVYAGVIQLLASISPAQRAAYGQVGKACTMRVFGQHLASRALTYLGDVQYSANHPFGFSHQHKQCWSEQADLLAQANLLDQWTGRFGRCSIVSRQNPTLPISIRELDSGYIRARFQKPQEHTNGLLIATQEGFQLGVRQVFARRFVDWLYHQGEVSMADVYQENPKTDELIDFLHLLIQGDAVELTARKRMDFVGLDPLWGSQFNGSEEWLSVFAEPVQLSKFEAALCQYVDRPNKCVKNLVQDAMQGVFSLYVDGEICLNEEVLSQVIPKVLPQKLNDLYRKGLVSK